MRERYEQAADKERYAEIRQHLDCAQLLASLSHSHGLNPDLYQVTTAKDGTPRIQCGSRALTPSDFLTKELGLPWKDAAPILRQTYEHQIGQKVTKPRLSNGVPPQLWKEFTSEQRAAMAKVKAFDEETKLLRKSLFNRLTTEKNATLAGLSGSLKKSTRSREGSRSVKAKTDFEATRAALLEAIQPPPKEQALRLFLQVRAQAGDAKALTALRNLDSTARTAPAQGITGTIYLSDGEDEKKKRRRAREAAASILSIFVVSTNGDVTYSQNGHAVLRDEGQHVAVLDQNSEEAIAAGLLLAREKFGPNLTLTGSPEFQRRVVAVAVAQGIPIKFVDPQLEATRLQLTDKKRQAARPPIHAEKTVAPAGHQAKPSHPVEAVAPTPPNKSAKRRIKAPLPEILAPAELHQVVPEAAQTAAEWSAGQPRPVVPPYLDGDASVAYVILHVAPDGIVVDHGRAIATYPVPTTGLALQVGGRVAIGPNGELRAPHVPTPGQDVGIG